MVYFIDQNVIEIVFAEPHKHFRAGHRLHGREQVFAIVFLADAGKQAEFLSGATEYFLI